MISTEDIGEGVLGNYGLTKWDQQGQDTLSLLDLHKISVASTFFQHGIYVTWTSFAADHTQHQLDHWITNNLHLVHDVRVTDTGVDRNHSAIIMNIAIKAKKKKQKETKQQQCQKLL